VTASKALQSGWPPGRGQGRSKIRSPRDRWCGPAAGGLPRLGPPSAMRTACLFLFLCGSRARPASRWRPGYRSERPSHGGGVRIRGPSGRFASTAVGLPGHHGRRLLPTGPGHRAGWALQALPPRTSATPRVRQEISFLVRGGVRRSGTARRATKKTTGDQNVAQAINGADNCFRDRFLGERSMDLAATPGDPVSRTRQWGPLCPVFSGRRDRPKPAGGRSRLVRVGVLLFGDPWCSVLQRGSYGCVPAGPGTSAWRRLGVKTLRVGRSTTRATTKGYGRPKHGFDVPRRPTHEAADAPRGLPRPTGGLSSMREKPTTCSSTGLSSTTTGLVGVSVYSQWRRHRSDSFPGRT